MRPTCSAEALRTAYESARNSADETHRLYLAGRESFISDLDATRADERAGAVAAAEGRRDRPGAFPRARRGWESDGTTAAADARPPRHAPPRHPRPAVITAALSSSVHHAHLETLGGGELS